MFMNRALAYSSLAVLDQAVSRWENGDTVPNTETLKLLSKEFNVKRCININKNIFSIIISAALTLSSLTTIVADNAGVYNNKTYLSDLKSYLLEASTLASDADVNQNGKVDVFDLVRLKSAILDREISEDAFSLSSIPEYTSSPYIELNNNIPFFSNYNYSSSFEYYSELDELGRCGTTIALLGKETIPYEERGEIGMIKPAGWHTVKYDNVDGKYLYNRCHLIGYQLSAENANTKNLITGTRYLNVNGMLPFENKVADYLKSSSNHVLYRVTRIYENQNLITSGVIIEAYSLEDNGSGISFCVYCYNVQPGIKINYETGESELISDTTPVVTEPSIVVVETQPSEDIFVSPENAQYILNSNTHKFHKPSCRYVKSIKEEYLKGANDRDAIISKNYEPCKVCNP